MPTEQPTMAQRIAQAAGEMQQQRTGHAPRQVTVSLTEDTLVITLEGALTPAEQALAATEEGARKVREYHRQLFAASAQRQCSEIERIVGVGVRESTIEVAPPDGAVVHTFTNGTMVQFFLLDGKVPSEVWKSASRNPHP